MRKLIFSAVLVIYSLPGVSGAQLLRYTFGNLGDETTSETAAAFAPTLFDAHLTASPVQDPLNTVGIEISSAATTPAGAPFLRLDPQGNSTTPAAAVAGNKFYQFTLAPESGYQMALDSIGFDVTRGGGSTPRGYLLRSSLDNYATDLAGGDLLTARPVYTPVSATLGSSFSALTSPVTFRFYNYAPSAGNSIDYDNIVVNGTVTVVPEPGIMAFAILGALSLALRKIRKKR